MATQHDLIRKITQQEAPKAADFPRGTPRQPPLQE